MNLQEHKKNWDEIAGLDACWAILSEPGKKYNRWEREEFFRNGEEEVRSLMESVASIGYPKQREHALDFGCGIGRVTRPLTAYFRRASGVDISDIMIQKARKIHRDGSGCEFILNEKDDLTIFPDGEFDLVYSNIVLQHMPAKEMVFRYIREFVRITREGGLILFQLPRSLPVLVKLQPRRSLYLLLRLFGVSERFLYRRLGLHPIRTLSVPQDEMVDVLRELPVKILQIRPVRDETFGLESNFYYLARTG